MGKAVGGGARVYDPSSVAERAIAPVFGNRDKTPATMQPASTTTINPKTGACTTVVLPPPKKLKAARLSKKQSEEQAKLKKQEEQAAARKARDEEQRLEELAEQEQPSTSTATRPSRGRPPIVPTTIPAQLFESEHHVTDDQLSGCAPPDLERWMRNKTRTLPTRPRASDTFNALDRKLWPSCVVHSPSDYFFRSKQNALAPPPSHTSSTPLCLV